MKPERIEELLEMAVSNLDQNDWFDYYNWDGFIECEESLTVEELEWMQDNFKIKIAVEYQSNGKVKQAYLNEENELVINDFDGVIL